MQAEASPAWPLAQSVSQLPPAPPAVPSCLLQLENGFEDAETHAKQDVGSMVFNTFIWCQVSARSAQHSAVQCH